MFEQYRTVDDFRNVSEDDDEEMQFSRCKRWFGKEFTFIL